jgi:hypothetical protein
MYNFPQRGACDVASYYKMKTYGGCAYRYAATDTVTAHSCKVVPCHQHSRQISSLYFTVFLYFIHAIYVPHVRHYECTDVFMYSETYLNKIIIFMPVLFWSSIFLFLFSKYYLRGLDLNP